MSIALTERRDTDDPALRIEVASWNVASTSNNPFEFFTASQDSECGQFIKDIQAYIESRSDDIEIHRIFNDMMFSEFVDELSRHDLLDESNLSLLKRLWLEDYRKRKAIAGFLLDRCLGLKRLASFPERITNTIHLQDNSVCFRPAVLSGYDEVSLTSTELWWHQWKVFIFHTSVRVCSGAESSQEPCPVYSLITPVYRRKYSAITDAEQLISVPLQLLCLALLDATLVYVFNTVAFSSWRAVRKHLFAALISNKFAKACSILAESYHNCDVVFLQEVSAKFVQDLRSHPSLFERYFIIAGNCNHGSLILASRARFDEAGVEDATQRILTGLDGGVAAPGDLAAASVAARDGAGRWLLASFHSDCDQLPSRPLLRALTNVAARHYGDHVLLAGLGANIETGPGAAPHQTAEGFAAFLRGEGLVSCWGSAPDPAAWTACSARTYVQPRPDLAAPTCERLDSDISGGLLDWIVARRATPAECSASRDNTGRRRFVDGAVLPSAEFPSHHAIVSAGFRISSPPSAAATAGDSAFAPSRRTFRPQEVGRRVLEQNTQGHWHPLLGPLVGGSSPEGAAAADRYVVDSGLSCSEEVSRVVEAHYLRLAWGTHWGELDGRAVSAKWLPQGKWALFSARPCTHAIQRPWVCALVVLTGSFILVQGAVNAAALRASNALLSGPHVRLTLLPSGNGSASEVGPQITALGVLQGGCRALAAPLAMSAGKGVLSVLLPEPVAADGWWFDTAATGPASDGPLRYRLEQSADGVAWAKVAYPKWSVEALVWSVPAGHGATKEVDLRPPALWVLSKCGGPVSLFLACLLSCAFGLAGKGRAGVMALVAGFTLETFFALAWAVQAAAAGDRELVGGGSGSVAVDAGVVLVAWVRCTSFAMVTMATFTERYLLEAMLVFLVVNGPVSVYSALGRWTDTGAGADALAWAASLVWSILTTLVLLGLVVARSRTLVWVQEALLADDRSRFDAVWNEVCLDDRETGAITALGQLSASICASLDPSEARQYHLSEAGSQQWMGWGEPALPCRQGKSSLLSVVYNDLEPTNIGRSSLGRTYVRSLDQLMEQAACHTIFLRSKCKELALVSKGEFMVATPLGGAGQSEKSFWPCTPASEAGQHQLWLWVDVKSSERAVEKVLQSYNGDVSRLLDCSRQSIYFETVFDLLCCLRTLIADKEIRIVRLKNRMDSAFDTRKAGGFRCTLFFFAFFHSDASF